MYKYIQVKKYIKYIYFLEGEGSGPHETLSGYVLVIEDAVC